MAPPARTITVALDMSNTFDTINIHTLIRKLLQTNIPGTIIKFIANYIKGRKACTTYRIQTIPQGGILPHTLFNIYTSDLPPLSAPVKVMAYSDDIASCKNWVHKRCNGVRGDLSRVADGFMYRRRDGTIQEADLAEYVMVDGETYERV